jgi:GT2 family glycosyltransferase
MSSQSVEAMICKIKNSENIIYDDTADYRIAFDLADAIITDGTTFCVEFLYTGRPILLTPRNIKGFYLYEEMIKNYYIAEDINDVAEYIDMIRNDKDPLREKRITMRDDVLFIPEGCSVGENIMNNVKHNLEEECENGLLASYLSDIGSTLSSRTLLKQVPLISILVLCYKNQDLLYEMLDSIFVQDYQRIQLVISDDGSSDFDKNMIEQYIRLNSSNIEEYIVLNNPVNMGTVKHIIYAMQHVKGDYLVFTAADDRFSSEKAISKYIEAFSQNLDAKWIVARCKITTPDYKKVIYIAPTDEDIPFFQSGDSQLLFSRWARRGMGVPCQMCFSRDAIDLVGGFDSNYQYLEDWPLELKLLRNGFAPIYIDEITAVHSTGGISNSNSRYDVLTRKAFYDDKYLLFEREVEPYKDLMASDDLRLYEVYRREILERLYFFHITLYGLSAPAKLKATIRSPKHLCWVLEQQYLKHRHRLKRKQACLVAQVLLFCSMFLLNSDGILESFYRMLGWVNLVGGVLLMILVTVSLPMDLFYTWKKKLRSKLVN